MNLTEFELKFLTKDNDLFLKENIIFNREEIDKYYSLVSGSRIPWYFFEKSNPGYDDPEDAMVFAHYAYFDNQPSFLYSEFVEIFDKFISHFNVSVRSILRVRVNMFLGSGPSKKRAGAHVDFSFPHKVFLYYFNDSDGDTIFYKEPFSGNAKPSNLEKEVAISARAGKGIFFDGLTFHSPEIPTDGKPRFTLNVDFL